jgi:hypothetical protein
MTWRLEEFYISAVFRRLRDEDSSSSFVGIALLPNDKLSNLNDICKNE